MPLNHKCVQQITNAVKAVTLLTTFTAITHKSQMQQ